MAHGLKEPSGVRVHQALHGYADGHRQIALSTPLQLRDQKTLLALSDISGPGAQIEEDGYLTGYPLADSGFYALARSWPAPEMPRPGCVWTHTLLIDFNDLAALESAASLLTLFERPSGHGGFQKYAKPKPLNVEFDGDFPLFDQTWAKAVLGALYGRARSRIIVSRSYPEVDNTTLAIWLQQWPRLRRSFRFCTLAASDRSVDGAGFDLQVISGSDRSVRSRFVDVVDAESTQLKIERWLEDALQDLTQPDSSGLRSFFRRLGSDIQTGREAFRPLCLLHRALANLPINSRAIHEAVDIVRGELGSKYARTARAIVANAALGAVETLDDVSFEFLWANLGLIDPAALPDSAPGLARAILRRDPRKLVDLLDNDKVSGIVADRILEALTVDELISYLKVLPELTAEALARRADIVGDARFWAEVEEPDLALQTALNQGLQSAAVFAMIDCRRNELAAVAVRAFGAKVTLDALNGISHANNDNRLVWVQEAAKDTQAVARFFAEQSAVQRDILYALARTLPPDAVPNDYGIDPWLSAWRNSAGMIDDTATTYVMAYLLTRALGQRSRSQAELAQLTFEPTHDATGAGRLPEDAWLLLEPRLPWSIFWLTWDRCQRIRAVMIDLFVDRNLPPRAFCRLTRNGQLFSSLAEGAVQSLRGREYMRRALIDMQRAGSSEFKEHIQTLRRLFAV
ncbi:hypothetical protein [Paraburkholderia rhizosphaerae]|uniref:Uncharacterized protein n=1 Tax=Paraburkholderia rhizosphaerae TaxID=480658 RepID=A0A4R8LRR0_9BURK|nr:hypothetical protein [Paraburkholderia rhizosphaerae]TDY48243.1 hypothetical protein BX592_111178 [Paraburkholderia rhizosphaerae]